MKKMRYEHDYIFEQSSKDTISRELREFLMGNILTVTFHSDTF